jgi:hypothetical protein
MPSLPLDDVQRYALAREFERKRMAPRVRCEPAPDAHLGGDPSELGADGGR